MHLEGTQFNPWHLPSWLISWKVTLGSRSLSGRELWGCLIRLVSPHRRFLCLNTGRLGECLHKKKPVTPLQEKYTFLPPPPSVPRAASWNCLEQTHLPFPHGSPLSIWKHLSCLSFHLFFSRQNISRENKLFHIKRKMPGHIYIYECAWWKLAKHNWVSISTFLLFQGSLFLKLSKLWEQLSLLYTKCYVLRR